MKNVLTALALVTLAAVSDPAAGKSETIRIEITGPSLAKPFEITDAGILRSFIIWNGPGSRSENEKVGAFIDWPRGHVPAPAAGLRLFDVTFHQRATGPHRRYVVRYAYDPASAGGYIYLPTGQEGPAYSGNQASISHGVEGNWFHSSAAWERLVRPLIHKATSRVTARAAASR